MCRNAEFALDAVLVAVLESRFLRRARQPILKELNRGHQISAKTQLPFPMEGSLALITLRKGYPFGFILVRVGGELLVCAAVGFFSHLGSISRYAICSFCSSIL